MERDWMKKIGLLLIGMGLGFSLSYGQEQQTGEEKETPEFLEFFTLHPNRKAVARDSSRYPSKLILAPIITFAPETSLGIGVGAKYLFKLRGSGEETRTSNLPVSLIYTLENQFILFSGFEVFFNQEKWMLTGNAIVKSFPQFYYGIGRRSSEENEEEYSFTQVLLEPILLKRAFLKYLFVGGGIRYNKITNVEAVSNGLLESSGVLGALGSTSVGAEFALVYDSRDNILNAQTGWYMEFTQGIYGKVLGGTHGFRLTRLDLRHFIKPFARRDDVIGFQFKAQLSYGNTPLAELAQYGSEEIMRGYYEGRFVDRHMMAVQVEYRRHLFGRFGGVVFLGAGDVSNEFSKFSLAGTRPNAGVGLRFLLDDVERLNIRLDWGAGRGTSSNYLNIAEAF